MRLVARSRFAFAFALVLALLLLAAALSGVPFMPRQSALAAPGGADALNVELVGTYDTSSLDRRADRVFVHEGHAYLVFNAFNTNDPSSSRNAVDEVNVSNPSNPQRNNTFGIDGDSEVVSGPGTAYTIHDIFVKGPIAYLMVNRQSLYSSVAQFWALNLATTPPTKICSYWFQDGASSVVADDNYAYVGTGKTVQALNIAAPDANQQCGAGNTYTLDGFVRDMVDVEDSLYVATSTGLEILGAAHTSLPVSGGLRTLAVSEGGLVAAASSTTGVHLIDASTPSNPRLLGTYPGSAFGVAVDGSYLYVARSDLHAVDISDPSNPTKVGHYNDPGQNNSSAIYDVVVAEGLIHTNVGIFRYAPEPCLRNGRGRGGCGFALHFIILAPTVEVDNEVVEPGIKAPIGPQTKIALGPPAGKGEVEMTCSDFLVGLASFIAHTSRSDPVMILIALDTGELLRKYCPQSPPTSAQGTGPDLGFRLEQGTVRVGGEVPALELNIGTTSATAQSTGVNLFDMTHLPDTGATTVGALNGTVQVVPTNSALPPVILHRNEQVTVTASEVSPVTPYGSSVFLPLALSAD